MRHIKTLVGVAGLFLLILIGIERAMSQQASKPEIMRSLVKTRDTFVVLNRSDIRLFDQRQKKEESSAFDYSKAMPWITVMFVGILTAGANIYLGFKLRKSSELALREQMDTATKNTISQIQVSRENNQRDFNKTVLSGNRQLWIAEFRGVISSILSMVSSFMTRQSITDQQFQELKILLIKAELMLGLDDEQLFVVELKNLEQFCYKQLLKLNNIDDLDPFLLILKKHALKRLDAEWEKVKKGI